MIKKQDKFTTQVHHEERLINQGTSDEHMRTLTISSNMNLIDDILKDENIGLRVRINMKTETDEFCQFDTFETMLSLPIDNKQLENTIKAFSTGQMSKRQIDEDLFEICYATDFRRDSTIIRVAIVDNFLMDYIETNTDILSQFDLFYTNGKMIWGNVDYEIPIKNKDLLPKNHILVSTYELPEIKEEDRVIGITTSSFPHPWDGTFNNNESVIPIPFSYMESTSRKNNNNMDTFNVNNFFLALTVIVLFVIAIFIFSYKF